MARLDMTEFVGQYGHQLIVRPGQFDEVVRQDQGA